MSKLPYVATTTFAFNGETFPTEHGALRAAIIDVLGNTGVTTQVISHCHQLAPLLTRAAEIGMAPPPPTPGKVADAIEVADIPNAVPPRPR